MFANESSFLVLFILMVIILWELFVETNAMLVFLQEQEGATLLVSAKFSVVSSRNIYLQFEEVCFSIGSQYTNPMHIKK